MEHDESPGFDATEQVEIPLVKRCSECRIHLTHPPGQRGREPETCNQPACITARRTSQRQLARELHRARSPAISSGRVSAQYGTLAPLGAYILLSEDIDQIQQIRTEYENEINNADGDGIYIYIPFDTARAVRTQLRRLTDRKRPKTAKPAKTTTADL